MGFCCDKDEDRRHEMMAQDLDFGAQVELKFNARFARENSNDRGEKMSLVTAKMVSKEFLLYMWAIQKFIRRDLKEEKERNKLKNKSEGNSVEAKQPFDVSKIKISTAPCPPMIGRFWDLLVCYSKNYQIFCHKHFEVMVEQTRGTSKDDFYNY